MDRIVTQFALMDSMEILIATFVYHVAHHVLNVQHQVPIAVLLVLSHSNLTLLTVVSTNALQLHLKVLTRYAQIVIRNVVYAQI